jgi:hypothetical protein
MKNPFLKVLSGLKHKDYGFQFYFIVNLLKLLHVFECFGKLTYSVQPYFEKIFKVPYYLLGDN